MSLMNFECIHSARWQIVEFFRGLFVINVQWPALAMFHIYLFGEDVHVLEISRCTIPTQMVFLVDGEARHLYPPARARQ